MKVVTRDISDEEMAMFLNICICELQRLNIKQISYIYQKPFWHEKVPLPKVKQMYEWDMPILWGVYQHQNYRATSETVYSVKQRA